MIYSSRLVGNQRRNLQITSFSRSRIIQLVRLLDEQTKLIHDKLFNERKEVVQLEQVLPFRPLTTPMPLCNKTITKAETSYICFDCMIHDGLLICKDCFWNGLHKGHRYKQVKENGACDCGDKTVMKPQHYCKNHSGVQIKQNIAKQVTSRFARIMSQLFSWAFQLQNSRQSKPQNNWFGYIRQVHRQQLLIEPLVYYLLHLNQSSLYYMQLTCSLFFDSFLTLHLQTLLTLVHGNELEQELLNLFMKMIVMPNFKEQMLPFFVHMYAKVQWFQSSIYQRLYWQLLANSQLVERVMSTNPIAFLPCQALYNAKTYYQHLHFAVTTLSQTAASAFLQPILQNGFIKFPMLIEIERRCEQRNEHIINVYTQHIQEEFKYYKLLMAIIGRQNRSGLRVMLRSYYKMIQEYSFKKNKIILVPQRVFVLLVFKYFNFDLQKIHCQQLANVLQISTKDLSEFINTLGVTFINCLGEFGINLSRTTHFDNYLPIYIKEESQIVLVDYLGIKMAALMSEGDFPHIILELYKYKGEIEGFNGQKLEQQSKQMVRKWNNIIKMLVQICLSPRTEMVVQSMLGVQLPIQLCRDVLTQLLIKTGEVSLKDLESLKNLFFGGKLSQTVQNQCLSFNNSNKKFSLRENVEDGHRCNPLWTQYSVSLLKNNLKKVTQVTNSQQTFKHRPLNATSKLLEKYLINGPFLSSLLFYQLRTIGLNQADFMILMKEFVTFVKSLETFIGQDNLNKIMDEIMKDTICKAEKRQDKFNLIGTNPIKINVEQIQMMIGRDNKDRPIQETNENPEVYKRRQLLKLKKKQKMKQIHSNQQLTLSNYNHPIQDNSEHICLVCREGSNRSDLCYVGKVKVTNLLFDILNIKGDHLIFDSCFHTIHYSCFIDLTVRKKTVLCPLCKVACNTVLPMDSASDSLLSKINNQIQVTQSLMKKLQQEQLFMEGVKYFGYIILLRIQARTNFCQKQAKLYRSVFSLMKSSFYSSKESNHYRNIIVDKDPLETTRIKHKFDYQTYINCISTIFTEYMEFGELWPVTISETVNKFHTFMSGDQTQYMLWIIYQVVSLILQTTNIQEAQETFKGDQSFFRFIDFRPPTNARGLLALRDQVSHECMKENKKANAYICIICKKTFCENCYKSNSHLERHKSDCLFFKTQTGGLLYHYRGTELHIRSLYCNQYGKILQPQYEADQYYLEEKFYAQVLDHLKKGNLFHFLTHTIEDLKKKDIDDRI